VPRLKPLKRRRADAGLGGYLRLGEVPLQSSLREPSAQLLEDRGVGVLSRNSRKTSKMMY
jgi:hypothetical protein